MSSSALTPALRSTLSLFEAERAPLTTREVADSLDIGRRSAYERLQRLVDGGDLKTKKVGASARVWWSAPDAESTGLERTQQDNSEQLGQLVDAVEEYAIYTIDTDGYIQTWNPGAERIKGYEAEEIVGEHFSMFYTVDERGRGVPERNLAAAAARGTIEDKGWRVHADGSLFWANATITAIRDEQDVLQGFAKIVREVTDRKERQEKLQRYANLIDAVNEPVYALDSKGRFTFVNDAMVEKLGYDEDTLLGEHVSICMDDDKIARSKAQIKPLFRGEIESPAVLETEVVTKCGERLPVENRISLLTDEDGQIRGSAGVVWDISERKKREQERETHIRQQEVVATLGKTALENPDLDVLISEATEFVADSLDADYCKVLEFDADSEELLLCQGVGWDDDLVGKKTVSAVEDSSQAAHTLAADHPVVVEDLDRETRFSGSELLTDHDVTSGISVVIGSHEDPWGILGVHDTEAQEFTEQEVTFVQSIANILATAINRHRDEKVLHEQREELATLNNLNAIVHDITETVIAQSTREEIEQAVCDALAATDSYEFAWLADVDTRAGELTPRAAAGTKGYADDITIPLNSETPANQGPGAKAVSEQEIQVTQNVCDDPAFEQWQEAAETYGFTSLASIPIIYEGTVYGVLGVYADRKSAFEAAEQTVISRLGEVVGHAIAAVERKRALVNTEVTELTFQIPLSELDIETEMQGTISFDEVVPIKDGEFLVYGSATADARAGMEQLIENLPHWEAVTFHDDDGESTFELKLSDHPVLSTLVSLGGTLEAASIEDGNYHLVVQLATGANVGRLIEAVKESYPNVKLATRRQMTREETQVTPISVVDEMLTDRQLTTLQAAYHAGFFEWPRDSAGKDVAESLDIAPPTFHHHLRKAEKKIVESVLAVE